MVVASPVVKNTELMVNACLLTDVNVEFSITATLEPEMMPAYNGSRFDFTTAALAFAHASPP